MSNSYEVIAGGSAAVTMGLVELQSGERCHTNRIRSNGHSRRSYPSRRVCHEHSRLLAAGMTEHEKVQSLKTMILVEKSLFES